MPRVRTACTPENIARLAASLPHDKLVEIATALQKNRLFETSAAEIMRRKYFNDPLGWIDAFVNITLPAYDRELFAAIGKGREKIAVHGPHGIGKTVFASLLVLWAGSVSNDCKIITTTSSWLQLYAYLWPEIHKWFGRVHWERMGIRPKLIQLHCQFSENSQAFAAASTDSEKIEGAHADRVVYIFDEAKIIPAGTWESAEGAFASPGNHLQVALSTPGDTSGIFYSICSRRPGYESWYVRHISIREAIRNKRMTIAWAHEKRLQWGPDNPVYQNRVWGIFAKDDENGIIPLSWVNQAVNRWHKWFEAGRPVEPGTFIIGADTAGQGVDKTVFAHRHGRVLHLLQRENKSRPMELAGRLKQILGEFGILNIDITFGEGAGTADRLSELEDDQGRKIFRNRINPIHFGAKTERKDRSGLLEFANTRAALWYCMRERLDPENGEEICLPDDPLLIGDLVAPRKAPRSDGKIMVESKEDIKARLGRSPDDGDACCMAFFHDGYALAKRRVGFVAL